MVGLGQTKAADSFAGCQLWQVFLTLRLTGELINRENDEALTARSLRSGNRCRRARRYRDNLQSATAVANSVRSAKIRSHGDAQGYRRGSERPLSRVRRDKAQYTA
jgi:hypothetical protein